jgi:hypothetical protein
MMVTVRARRIATAAMLTAFAACVGGCSREQQDWRAAESRDTTQSYGQFIELHPDSELVKQARTRIAQLGEARDWSRAAQADTATAYEQFLAEHPSGKWAPEARIRMQNFTLGAAPGVGTAAAAAGAVPAPAPLTPPATPTEPTKGYGIQLGAFSSEERANTEWHALQGRYAAQLQGLAPQVLAADTASGRVFRLQALAGDEARARLICDELRKLSQQCVPVVPH